MKRQLAFIDLKIAPIIPPDDSLKTLFQYIHLSFFDDLTKDKPIDKGRKGNDLVCLFKTLLLIYLDYASIEIYLPRKTSLRWKTPFTSVDSLTQKPPTTTPPISLDKGSVRKPSSRSS